MFNPVKDMQKLPYSADSIVKIYRGMNMVNVSIGDYTSEPSEVYITTSSMGEALGTYIVFYFVAHETRAIYEYGGNPYTPDERIKVESEAKEFVEEMGAILEDIGWETMSGKEKESWLKGQYLLSPDEVPESEEDAAEVVELADDAIMEESPEEELEIVEEIVEPEEVLEQIVRDDEDEDLEDISEDDADAVFIEEKFDELLKKAFLKSKESTEGADEEDWEESGSDQHDEKKIDQEITTAEPESKEADGSTSSFNREAPDDEAAAADREIVLKFLSKF